MIGFITFEGIDGSGKTTQLKALESHLCARGRSCVITREPGGTPLGNLIRQVLLDAGKQPIALPTELFLYLADRAQHVQDVIVPALNAGHIVLCDRYTDSTLAYQGYGRGIELRLLQQLNEFANGGVRPDLTFLLDCPVAQGLSRTAQRQRNMPTSETREDRFEREELDFHERVRAGFLDMARAEARRFRVINAERSAEEVAQEIRQLVDREI
jgi:dTMP kinase